MHTFLLLFSVVGTGTAVMTLTDRSGVYARHVGHYAESLGPSYPLNRGTLTARSTDSFDEPAIHGLRRRGNCVGRACGTIPYKGSKVKESHQNSESPRYSPGQNAYNKAILGTQAMIDLGSPSLSRASSGSRDSGRSKSPSALSITQRGSASSEMSSMAVHAGGSRIDSMDLPRGPSIGSRVSTGSRVSQDSKVSKKSLDNRWTGASFGDWMPSQKSGEMPQSG